ncbi:50S ribosomal protein L10 [Pyrodictium abyssi]|uniref:Large ribosomal subunit protein uL10 n=1 Tax=Pyrodictium abyssi TaxID=54256 RepID=A0ABN6ZS33_9CREN|nr:50S ribosomal protein L10 [Pyrodictium abyssi]
MSVVQARARRIPEWKIKEVEELAELAKNYRVVAIVDLSKTPTAQLQRIRRKIERKFGDKVVLRVAKNTLFKLALKKAGVDPSPLEPYLTGTNMFIFTNLNPFELALALEKIYATKPAKPGDIAPTEIVLPAGDTGFKPGPIMSVFGKLRVPIRVQGGSIWIAKDTKVAKPGDEISPELASILQKLGIEPIIVKLKVKAAYEDGVVIPADKLILDLEAYRRDVAQAHLTALMVGVEIAYPEPQVLEIAIPMAVRRALAVAAEAGYVTPDNAEYVIGLAVARALAVVAALGDTAKELGIDIQVAAPAAAAAPAEEKKEEEEEETEEKKEEVSEEQLAAGLESLFGF